VRWPVSLDTANADRDPEYLFSYYN